MRRLERLTGSPFNPASSSESFGAIAELLDVGGKLVGKALASEAGLQNKSGAVCLHLRLLSLVKPMDAFRATFRHRVRLMLESASRVAGIESRLS